MSSGVQKYHVIKVNTNLHPLPKHFGVKVVHCLDDNEEVYSNNSTEKSKYIESYPAYLIKLCPLENHKIEKVIFTRLQ